MIEIPYYNAADSDVPAFGIVQLQDILGIPLDPNGATRPLPSDPSGFTPTLEMAYTFNAVQPDGTGPYAIDWGGGCPSGQYGSAYIPTDRCCWVAYSPSQSPTTPFVSGVGAVSQDWLGDDGGSDFTYAGQFDAQNQRVLVYKPPGTAAVPYVVTSLTNASDANGGDFNGANQLAYYYSAWGNSSAGDQVFQATAFKSGLENGYIEQLPGKPVYVSSRFIQGVLFTGQLFLMQPIQAYGKDSGDNMVAGSAKGSTGQTIKVKGDVTCGGMVTRWENATITNLSPLLATFVVPNAMLSQTVGNRKITVPVTNNLNFSPTLNQVVTVGWKASAVNSYGNAGTPQGFVLLDYACPVYNV
jgi:hypothetical protein